MKKTLLFLFTLFILKTASAQTLVSATFYGSYTKSDIVSQLPFAFSGLDFGVDAYVITYMTTDPFGNPILASGALHVPAGCTNFPLVSYQHGTVLHKSAVASVNPEDVGMLAAGFGFAVTSPDFLGLGSSPGPHPYLHAETEATSAIDLMRVARDFMIDSLSYTLNDELFLVGYSQGGHATMALHKYIEDNNLLGEFNIKGSAPLAGPFDLAGVQFDQVADSTYAAPAYIPYMINSYQHVYGNIYNTPSDFYKSPYDVAIPPMLNGNFTLSQLTAILPNNVYQMLQDSVIQNVIADSLTNQHPTRVAMIANSNYDWLPTRPIRMAYCDGDEQVNYQNSLVALNTMTANGATQVEAIHTLPGADHSGCALPSLLNAIYWFLDSATICTPWATSTEVVDHSKEVNIYPNPTTDWLNINLSNDLENIALQLDIVNMNGQVVYKETIENQSEVQLSLKHLGSGIYFVRMYNERVTVWKKVVLY